MNENKYLFDEYIIHGTPEQKEKATNWRIAIGLQDVDHLRVSAYLVDLARKNIEGELTMDEVQKLIHEHYQAK